MFTNLSGLFPHIGKLMREMQSKEDAIQNMPIVEVPSLVQKYDSQKLVTLEKKEKDRIANILIVTKSQILANKALLNKFKEPIAPGFVFRPSEQFNNKYDKLLKQELDIENQQKLLEEYKVYEDDKDKKGVALEGIERGGPILRWQDQ